MASYEKHGTYWATSTQNYMSVRIFIFCLKSVFGVPHDYPDYSNQVLKTAQGDKYAILYAHKMIHEPGIKKNCDKTSIYEP